MTYLFAAYTVIWVVLFGYIFSLSRLQQKFQDELARLQELLENRKKS
jgi:CcmD family protein